MLPRDSRSRVLLVVLALVVVAALVAGVLALTGDSQTDDRAPSAALVELAERDSLGAALYDDDEGAPGETPADRAVYLLTEVDWDADQAEAVVQALLSEAEGEGGDQFVAGLVDRLADSERPLRAGTARGVLTVLADRPWEVIRPFAVQVEDFAPQPRIELGEQELAQVLVLAGADPAAAEAFRFRMLTALRPMADRTRLLMLDERGGDARFEAARRVEDVWLTPLAEMLGFLTQATIDKDYLVERSVNEVLTQWSYEWTPPDLLPPELVVDGRPVPVPLIDGPEQEDAYGQWRTSTAVMVRFPKLDFLRATNRDPSP